MALDQYANFVRGSLTAAVDNSQTTFPVNNASIFPDPASGNYNLVVWDVGSHPRPDQDPDVEVVRVTGRDTGTDELTVTRGQEATTGVSHPSGSALHLSYTAKLAADIETDYVADGENFDGQGTSEFTNLAAVSTDEALIKAIDDWNGPTKSGPLQVLGSADGQGLQLQNQDDSQSTGPGRANITWWSHGDATGAAEQLAALTSHPSDNHFSIYTKTDGVGAGDTGVTKRVNIPGGIEQTEFKIQSNEDAYLRLFADHDGAGGGRPILDLLSNNNSKFQLRYSPTNDQLQLRDIVNGRTIAVYEHGDPEWNWLGTPMSGLREISNPTPADLFSGEWAWDATDDRWMFKDSGGTVHGFTPDTTY